ncbi:MAG: hypothetical protein R3200_02220, partial [Xanthomonadales bacterium]|nr:hypothetical protein [Xanthomonadales bacterium]
MSKKTWLKIVTAVLLVGSASIAQACVLTAWLLQDGIGDAVAGGPNPNETNNFARYSGTCAMQVTSGNVGDPSPADEARMISRFFFRPTGTGSADIYQTYATDNGTGTATYTVTYDNGTITVTDIASGAASAAIPVNVGAWNSVEIDWSSAGTVNVWVNADAGT